ncbi:hypothetical protein HGG78_17840 [Vibrio aestuarianus]|nr:hypothetical protein [Vibrio aestuarianus]NKZ51727.1 hypothetical protein [Vibrio aestuarianus]
MRFVDEKYKSVLAATDQLVISLSGENESNKINNAKIVKKATGDLRSALSEVDQPKWLTGLNQIASLYAEGHRKSHQLMQFILENRLEITKHTWSFDDKSDAFDFDSIFERYRSESRLDELFEEIIKILEEIQSSGEVDSVMMISALGKVIATLKKSKDGSYFSLNSAWSFLISFLQNYMWAELSKLPVLGTAMEALKKTIEETNEEMFKMHTEVQNEMENTVKASVKGLKQPEFGFIGYDRQGNNLEESSTKLISTTV